MKFSKKEFENLDTLALTKWTKEISDIFYSFFAYFGVSYEDYEKKILNPTINRTKTEYDYTCDYEELFISILQSYLKRYFSKSTDKAKTTIEMLGKLTSYNLEEALEIVKRYYYLSGAFFKKDSNNIFEKLLETNSILNQSLKIVFDSQEEEIRNGNINEVFEKAIASPVVDYCTYYNIGMGYDEDGMAISPFGMQLPPILSKEEQTELAIKAREGNIEARNRLVVSNLRFIKQMAKKYIRDGISFDDLVDEGIFGMMEAIKDYDETKGAFTTHSYDLVKKYMWDLIIEQSRALKLNSHIYFAIPKYQKTCALFLEENGRIPTTEEIMAILHWTRKTVKIVHALAKGEIYLDQKIDNSNDIVYGDVIPNRNTPVDEAAIDRTMVSQIMSCNFTKRQQEILKELAGLNDGVMKEKATVARILGVKRQAVDNNMKKIRSTLTGSERGIIAESNIYSEEVEARVRRQKELDQIYKEQLETKSLEELLVELYNQLPKMDKIYFELFIRQRGLNNGLVMSKNELAKLFNLDDETMRNAIQLVISSISKNEKAKTIYQIIMKKREQLIKESYRNNRSILEVINERSSEINGMVSSSANLSEIDKGMIALRLGFVDGIKRSIAEIAIFYEMPCEMILEKFSKISQECNACDHLKALCEETENDKKSFSQLTSFIVAVPVKRNRKKNDTLEKMKTAS